MKTIQSLVTLAALILSLSSCQDFLEERPLSQASPENYYETADHAESAVVGAYNALQRIGLYGRLQYFKTTDLVRTAPWNTEGGMGSYTFSADNPNVILPMWQDHFKGINEANAVITNVPNIDMDVDRRNTLVAEARFLRALQYFNLVRYFGAVPFFETETNSLENLDVTRDSVDLVYEKIIADLEYSIENLDMKWEATPGRATVGAAKTLLAKVYLTRGSMAQRDATGDGNADFQMAANIAGEVIDSGDYQLMDYFPDAFIRENKNNDEIIFDVQFKSGGIDEGNYIGAHLGLQGPPELGGSWGTLRSTEYFHTIYEPTDMVRQEWTTAHVRVMGNGSIKTDYPEMNGQPWKIGKWRRYPIRDANYVYEDWDQNWPVFRYSEVLLIYAEALNEVNNGPTAEVFDALNQLRARARHVNDDGTREYLHEDVLPRNITYDPNILPDISSVEYPDYASIKDYLFFERARELGGEGKRWFDLVRWGKLVEQLQFLGTHVPEGRRFAERDWATIAANVADHHLLFPIPSSDLQANPNLTQNPGY